MVNNGVANQATRCFRRIVEAFASACARKIRTSSSRSSTSSREIWAKLPSHDDDLVLSSGGPGSPHDGFDDPWCTGFRGFIDHVVESNRSGHGPKLLAVCHSFQLSVLHPASRR